MYIFALDSSGKTSSVCIHNGKSPLVLFTNDSGLTHSETLMPLCARAFEAARLTPADIDCFAMTAGPGSFTGLRIGMSVIKGMAAVFDRPCAPVSTTETLAHFITSGIAVPVMDARASRVYMAAFDNGTRLADDAAHPVSELYNLLCGYKKSIVFVGDAAEMCYNEVYGRLDCEKAAASLCAPSAEAVAEIAYKKYESGQAISAAAITPDYLQLPQAMRNMT